MNENKCVVSTNDIPSIHLEFHPTLYDTQLSRSYHQSYDEVIKQWAENPKRNLSVLSKFSLYVQASLLGKNQHVSVIIAESFVLHRCVGKIHMDGKSFTESGITVTSDRLQSINEVDFCGSRRKIERTPCKLSWTGVNSGIERKETGFKLVDYDDSSSEEV